MFNVGDFVEIDKPASRYHRHSGYIERIWDDVAVLRNVCNVDGSRVPGLLAHKRDMRKIDRAETFDVEVFDADAFDAMLSTN